MRLFIKKEKYRHFYKYYVRIGTNLLLDRSLFHQEILFLKTTLLKITISHNLTIILFCSQGRIDKLHAPFSKTNINFIKVKEMLRSLQSPNYS